MKLKKSNLEKQARRESDHGTGAHHHIGVKEIQQRTLADGVVLLYRSSLKLVVLITDPH